MALSFYSGSLTFINKYRRSISTARSRFVRKHGHSDYFINISFAQFDLHTVLKSISSFGPAFSQRKYPLRVMLPVLLDIMFIMSNTLNDFKLKVQHMLPINTSRNSNNIIILSYSSIWATFISGRGEGVLRYVLSEFSRDSKLGPVLREFTLRLTPRSRNSTVIIISDHGQN